jgi:hypothetical protein
LIRQWHSVAILLIAHNVFADFSGFPLASNTNAGNWYEARELYQPISQLYSGVVERCEWTGVSQPNIIETWWVSAGSSNTVSGAYTNTIILDTQVTTTNQIGAFEYTYTDPSGTYTNTAYTYLTRNFLHKLDEKIDALIPYFVDWSVAVSNSYDDYFGEMAEKYHIDTKVWSDFLEASKAGIFDREGIGYVLPETITTNAGGYTTGGTAYYTRQPETRNNWLIGELHGSTSGWQYVDVGTLDTNMYSTNFLPVVQYIQGGTNALSTSSITITGLVLNVSNQTTYSTSEVVSVSSTTTPCVLPWYDITDITTAVDINNTGDVFAVLYTNEVVLYGERPYRLYAQDLDERYYVLKNLVAIEHTDKRWYLPDFQSNYWLGSSSGLTSAPSAEASASSNYQALAGTDIPFKHAYIEFDTFTFGVENWDAFLRASQNRLEAYNIPTNATIQADIDLYFSSVAYGYDRSPADTNDQYFYDDYSRGYKTNQTQRLQTATLSLGATNFVGNFLADVIEPVFPLTDPPTVDGARYSRGFTIDDDKVLIRPAFEYK